jgi:DNA repair exonuclease SbcCD ATPase subunit
VLGTFDDFILTSLSLQTNGMNFLDKKQAERKKILSTFMDIEVFEQLESIAKSDSNEERVMLRQFQKKDSYREIGTINQRITELGKEETELSDKDKSIDDSLNKLEKEKIDLVRKLYKIDETYDIDKLQMTKSNLTLEKSNIETQLKDDLEYKEQLRPMYMDYHKKLSEIDEEKIQEDYENWKEAKQYLTELENKIKLNESKTKSLNHHNSDLMKFKYDENCEFCIKNGKEQIHEQEEIKTQIDKLYSEHSNLTAHYKKTEYSLQKLGNADKRNREFKIFSEELNQIQHDAVKIGGKISTQESRLKHIESDLKTTESNISRYYELEEKIENNKRLNEEISTLTTEISQLQLQSIDIDKQYKKVLSTLSVAKNQKQQIEDDIQNLVDIEQKILDYDLYLMALSKDGVPYELISKAIPSIEREINNVLENMNAGFHIELEMKDKMIDAFICYGDDKWNLELSSGMERFVSSLAIRIGLINVSTLPRPNFIIVDEGFGALDSDNIANMQGAFQYLRTQFDFTMIITHLDTIKDYMDTLIPINVNNGLSKVVMN